MASALFVVYFDEQMKLQNFAVLSFSLCFIYTAQGQGLVNASFEQPGVIDHGYNAPSSEIPGWTLSQGAVFLFSNARAVGEAVDGTQFLELSFAGLGATLTQPITALIIGQAYQVSFSVTAAQTYDYNGL